MVLNTRHTGIVVKDIDKAIKFYEGLGMVQLSRMVEEGAYIDKLVAIESTRLEWAKLKLPDGSLVELLQYHSRPSTLLSSEQQESNRMGCSHIAFTVDDIDKVSQYILAHGGSIKNAWQFSPDKKVKVMYCYDMEGNILEIVEQLIF